MQTQHELDTVQGRDYSNKNASLIWNGSTGVGVRALLHLAYDSGAYLVFLKAYRQRTAPWQTVGEAAAAVLEQLIAEFNE